MNVIKYELDTAVVTDPGCDCPKCLAVSKAAKLKGEDKAVTSTAAGIREPMAGVAPPIVREDVGFTKGTTGAAVPSIDGESEVGIASLLEKKVITWR